MLDELTEHLAETSKELLKDAATLVSPAIIIGVVAVGLKKMFSGLNDD